MSILTKSITLMLTACSILFAGVDNLKPLFVEIPGYEAEEASFE